MICKYCLTKIDDDSVFCESCGSRVQEIGNNDETQQIPKVEELKENRIETVSENGALYVDSKRDVPVSDISKLLSEIYDDEEDEDEEPKRRIALKREEETVLEKEEPEDKNDMVTVLQYESDPEPTEGEADDSEILPQEEDLKEKQKLQQEFKYENFDSPEPVSVFCMACGRKLPDGAAFCDACGTPTGKVLPLENGRRRNSIALPILKKYFVKPAEMIEKAAHEEAAGLGAGILVVKDILTAVIAALCMEQLTAGMTDSWILSGDAFGFGTKIFLLTVLTDTILCALVLGIGKLFRAKGNVKEIIAVCGVAYLLPAILWLLALALSGFVLLVGMCIALVALTTGVLFMGKAIDAAGKIEKNKSMYMTALILVIYIALIYGGLIWIIG